jgi:hypothetical protein
MGRGGDSRHKSPDPAGDGLITGVQSRLFCRKFGRPIRLVYVHRRSGHSAGDRSTIVWRTGAAIDIFRNSPTL